MTPERSPELADTRTDPPGLAPEREALETQLELCRQSFLLKVGGLTPEQLARRAVPPSTLSLVGLVRHLTEVERFWFAEVAHGIDAPGPYWSLDGDDPEFDDATAETALADLEAYRAEVDRAREHAARLEDLGAPVARPFRGAPHHLRTIYIHMIDEYARHLGHADLLREVVDGRTGY